MDIRPVSIGQDTTVDVERLARQVVSVWAEPERDYRHDVILRADAPDRDTPDALRADLGWRLAQDGGELAVHDVLHRYRDDAQVDRVDADAIVDWLT